MPLRPELAPRDDHRRVVADEAIDEGHRVDRELVAEEADRPRRRRGPVQLPGVPRCPVLEGRPAVVHEESRALEQLLAPLERDLRERFGERRRRDARVVLHLERRRDLRRRSDDPTDPEPGQPVDLRQPAGDDDPLAAPAEARALLGGPLGAAVHLVGDDPGAVPLGDAHDRADLACREDLSGRVVRGADADGLRARVHRGRERVEVDRP